jgi:hypothetical protein
MLPDVRLSWHLHHVFEKTIRQSPQSRFNDAAQAIKVSRWVIRLIEDRFKPLEQIADGTCPLCGIGKYGNTIGLNTYYANDMRPWGKAIAPVNDSFDVCPYCFHAVFRAKDALQKALEDRRKLD